MKILTNNLSKELEDYTLFTLNFHMPKHIVKNGSRFDSLNFLDVYSFQHFNDVIKNFISMTFMRRRSTLEEAAKAMNLSVAIEKKRNNTGGGIQKTKLVRHDTITNLVKIATATLASLAHMDNGGRGVLASQCLEIILNSFQLAGHRFLPCDWDVIIVKAEFIHRGIVITSGNYYEKMMLLN